jgi:hypothetical protein
MDNDYLYIVGFFGLVLVSFVVFYFLKKQNKKETMKPSEIQQHIEEDHNVECDGDKCFIKHRQTKYDKCDDEKCI